MICAKYLFTAEKMATPSEKFEAQKSVCPSTVQARRTSASCCASQPVDPLTTFTPCAQACR